MIYMFNDEVMNGIESSSGLNGDYSVTLHRETSHLLYYFNLHHTIPQYWFYLREGSHHRLVAFSEGVAPPLHNIPSPRWIIKKDIG